MIKTSKYIIDTNVPCMAGKSDPTILSKEESRCAQICATFINSFIHNEDSKLVLDQGYEIVKEYRNNITNNNQPTLANYFLDWVYQYLSRILIEDFIFLDKTDNNEYVDYPKHQELSKFDISDRKFIALANAHYEHPPIVQGTESKWWMLREIFETCGIHILFLDEEYIRFNLERMK